MGAIRVTTQQRELQLSDKGYETEKPAVSSGLAVRFAWLNLIAGQGLEPQFPGPEPDVLPLDDPAVRRGILEGGADCAREASETSWDGRPILRDVRESRRCSRKGSD